MIARLWLLAWHVPSARAVPCKASAAATVDVPSRTARRSITTASWPVLLEHWHGCGVLLDADLKGAHRLCW